MFVQTGRQDEQYKIDQFHLRGISGSTIVVPTSFPVFQTNALLSPKVDWFDYLEDVRLRRKFDAIVNIR